MPGIPGITNLGRPDVILALAVGVLMFATMALTTGSSEQVSLLIFLVPVLISVFVLMSFPSAIGVYWASSNLATLGQSVYLRHVVKREEIFFVAEIKRYGFTEALNNLADRRDSERSVPEINDPLAGQIGWGPLGRRKSQLPMSLGQPAPHLLTVGYRHWPFYGGLLMAIVGVWLLLLPFLSNYIPFDRWFGVEFLAEFIREGAIIWWVVGALLAVPGVVPLFGTYQRTIFNKRRGSVSRVQPGFAFRRFKPIKIALSRAHALQLLSYNVRSDPEKSSSVRYEMNLVLRDKKRLYLMASHNLKKVTQAAETMAKYLEIRVWDRTSAPIRDTSLSY